jgi:hypothetical protein
MNREDRELVEFILSCSEEEFEEWADRAELSEIARAMRLCKEARQELDNEEDRFFGSEDFDVSEAAAIIERIRNVGKN